MNSLIALNLIYKNVKIVQVLSSLNSMTKDYNLNLTFRLYLKKSFNKLHDLFGGHHPQIGNPVSSYLSAYERLFFDSSSSSHVEDDEISRFLSATGRTRLF